MNSRKRSSSYVLCVVLAVMMCACGGIEAEMTASEAGVSRHKGEYAEAIKLYQQAIEMHPEKAIYHYELAKTYIEDRQYRKAKSKITDIKKLGREDMVNTLEMLLK